MTPEEYTKHVEGNPMVYNGRVCPYCWGNTEHVEDRVVYGKTFGSMLYLCKPCDAYVGCHHKIPEQAKGRLADKLLREMKKWAHEDFDPLWRKKMRVVNVGKREARTKAYMWLASELGIDPEICHIGMFDMDMCKLVVEICKPHNGMVAVDPGIYTHQIERALKNK